MRSAWLQFLAFAEVVWLGDFFELITPQTGRTLGVCLRTNSVQPLYVSSGHRVALSVATELVLQCSQFRIPAPVRAADLNSREFIRKWEAAGKPAPVASADAGISFHLVLFARSFSRLIGRTFALTRITCVCARWVRATTRASS